MIMLSEYLNSCLRNRF